MFKYFIILFKYFIILNITKYEIFKYSYITK